MDVFSYSNGNLGQKDIFGYMNATGISEPCKLALPYPPSRMQQLLDMLSVARKNQSDAQQEKDKAHKDWADCKGKLFCNASPKNRRLNEKEVILTTAKTELARAENELKQAQEANDIAQKRYDKCRTEEKAEQARQDKLLEKEKEMLIETKKVSTASLETKKDYALYGLIGLGAVSMLVFGYIMIKN